MFSLLAESPRWLISKGRLTDADKVIRKIAKVNKKDLPEEFFANLELKDQPNVSITQYGGVSDEYNMVQSTLMKGLRNMGVGFRVMVIVRVMEAHGEMMRKYGSS